MLRRLVLSCLLVACAVTATGCMLNLKQDDRDAPGPLVVLFRYDIDRSRTGSNFVPCRVGPTDTDPGVIRVDWILKRLEAGMFAQTDCLKPVPGSCANVEEGCLQMLNFGQLPGGTYLLDVRGTDTNSQIRWTDECVGLRVNGPATQPITCDIESDLSQSGSP